MAEQSAKITSNLADDREFLLIIRQAALMGIQALTLIVRYVEKRCQLERK